MADTVLKESDDGPKANYLQCLGFKEDLIRTLGTFPCWTGVMKPFFPKSFSVATSAPVEGDYGDLKTRVFISERLPLRVDAFVSSHLIAIRGKAKEAQSKLLTRKQSNSPSMADPLVSSSEPKNDEPDIDEPAEGTKTDEIEVFHRFGTSTPLRYEENNDFQIESSLSSILSSYHALETSEEKNKEPEEKSLAPLSGAHSGKIEKFQLSEEIHKQQSHFSPNLPNHHQA